MTWVASSASAGGPTSVLVTSPASGQATGLYYSDKEYGALEQLLGAAEVGSRDQPAEVNLANARQINVTWMVHDMSPWRVDRVFPVDSGPRAVWIHTAANMPETPNGYWHRADHPAELRALLKKLGVMGKASGDASTGIFPEPWRSEEPTPEPATVPTDVPDTSTTTVSVGLPDPPDGTRWWSNWWWTLPGAAAGAGVALVLRPLASRLPPGWGRGGRESGPRQELRDV
ncbi:hypothetical protein [Streptomyces sp. NPDC088794]|uniref:hypothetical protein n=1 Tax=Streptomyces sp. NPDC088794 TaxID=3365902 RepID=UPI0038219109